MSGAGRQGFVIAHGQKHPWEWVSGDCSGDMANGCPLVPISCEFRVPPARQGLLLLTGTIQSSLTLCIGI